MSRNLGRSAEKAADLFRMWHAKEPDELIETSYPLEQHRVFRAGVADDILYVSDKWEVDGDVYDYHHDFDSGPSVYTTAGEGDEGDPARLLNIPEVSASTETSLPILGGVKELVIKHDDGSKQVLRFKKPPMMLSTLDKRGLVILTEDVGPIYIRGGRMVITERGIHH